MTDLGTEWSVEMYLGISDLAMITQILIMLLLVTYRRKVEIHGSRVQRNLLQENNLIAVASSAIRALSPRNLKASQEASSGNVVGQAGDLKNPHNLNKAESASQPYLQTVDLVTVSRQGSLALNKDDGSYEGNRSRKNTVQRASTSSQGTNRSRANTYQQPRTSLATLHSHQRGLSGPVHASRVFLLIAGLLFFGIHLTRISLAFKWSFGNSFELYCLQWNDLQVANEESGVFFVAPYDAVRLMQLLRGLDVSMYFVGKYATLIFFFLRQRLVRVTSDFRKQKSFSCKEIIALILIHFILLCGMVAPFIISAARQPPAIYSLSITVLGMGTNHLVSIYLLWMFFKAVKKSLDSSKPHESPVAEAKVEKPTKSGKKKPRELAKTLRRNTISAIVTLIFSMITLSMLIFISLFGTQAIPEFPVARILLIELSWSIDVLVGCFAMMLCSPGKMWLETCIQCFCCSRQKNSHLLNNGSNQKNSNEGNNNVRNRSRNSSANEDEVKLKPMAEILPKNGEIISDGNASSQ
jgi:hypothetical protein